jgi:hypothetical protein
LLDLDRVSGWKPESYLFREDPIFPRRFPDQRKYMALVPLRGGGKNTWKVIRLVGKVGSQNESVEYFCRKTKRESSVRTKVVASTLLKWAHVNLRVILASGVLLDNRDGGHHLSVSVRLKLIPTVRGP